MGKRQITLADLAKELNISTATVSRALKNYPDISDETKRKVLALAQAKNYRPNTMAAGLRNQESKIIGVIIPEIVNHFFSSVIKGIMQVCYDADYRVMLCQSSESYEKEVADANALFASRVDGLLVSLAHESNQFDHFADFQDAEIPIVLFDKVSDKITNTSKVVVDDYLGAFLAVEHMILTDRKRIAHFAGPQVASTSRNRLNGYRDALTKHGFPVLQELIFPCEEMSLEEGERLAKRMVTTSPQVDAVFCINDAVAIGAMVGVKRSGLSVPTDIAIAGFSDWQISSIVEPSLTTVSQPSFEMGKLAANILINEIRNTKEGKPITHETHTLKTSLKIRESSAGQPAQVPHVS